MVGVESFRMLKYRIVVESGVMSDNVMVFGGIIFVFLFGYLFFKFILLLFFFLLGKVFI